MKPVRHREPAERWLSDAMQAMDPLVARLGHRLIAQAHLDAAHQDFRLMDLLGESWYERMLTFGQKKPQTARRVWSFMVEHRRLPPC